LYRIQHQSPEDSNQSLQMGQVIAEAATLMARFRGLLRISELEDNQRRTAFVELDPRPLLHQLYHFNLPVAEEAALT
ncbi:two-component sensor histidine kinase, partial [Pseudomonas sp. MH10out]|nr:two-component sensor histidine kinase [Pseudomonas sp. MH10out]